MRSLTHSFRSTRSDSGGSLIETALLTPVLLLLVLGVGDFGRIMYHGITLGNAARAGASHGVHSVARLTDGAGIKTAAEQDAQDIGAITVGSQLICECAGGAVVTCGTTSCGGYGAPKAFVEVTATTTFTPISAVLPGIPGTSNLTRTARMRAQ